MGAGAVIAIVFILIFIIGIGTGIAAVIALSAIRKDRDDEAADDDLSERGRGASGVPGHWDGVTSDDQYRWPGDASDGFHGEEP